jgi:hypothetical protein
VPAGVATGVAGVAATVPLTVAVGAMAVPPGASVGNDVPTEPVGVATI